MDDELLVVKSRTSRLRRWLSLRRGENLGRWGEWVALGHLLRLGWDVLVRNWSCRTGELDLIAFEDETLVVIEVKTRSCHPDFPTPEEQVDDDKEARLEDLGWRFAARFELDDRPLRFDLIAIETPDRRAYELRHHRGFM